MNPIYINMENLSPKQQEEFLQGFRKEQKTTNKPNTTFGLSWFSAINDELVGEVDLPNVTPENVREWFFLSENDALTDSFIVRASQRQHIAKLIEEVIDLNCYDYFLECYQLGS